MNEILDGVYGDDLSDFCECGLYPFWFKANDLFQTKGAEN